MGLIRWILHLGQQADDGEVPDRPIYPPEDTLTFGYEEVGVTLALLIVSYYVLATPCFSKRSASRSGSRLNTGGWKESVSQLRQIRSRDELKRWWQQLRRRRQPRNFDSQKWDALMRTSHSIGDSSYDTDKTVRAKGGRSTPSSPLKNYFRPIHATEIGKIHASTSDGHLVESPTRLRRFSPMKRKEGGEGEEWGRDSFYEEDFRPETDHDRFEKAWQSHIRFADYRRLVLPPECKRVESTSHWHEAEQYLLENLLHESRLNRVISYVKNVIDILCGILMKMLSKETTRQLSSRIMGIFRYKFRKQQGLAVEEDDETDDDDDGSVTTLASNASKKAAKTGKQPKLPEITPVTNNRKSLSESIGSSGRGSPHVSTPKLCDDTIQQYGQGNENDSSFINVTPIPSLDKKRESFTEKSPSHPRLSTSEFNDDATFVSASGLEHMDSTPLSTKSLDIPASLFESSKNALSVSPLPMKHYPKQKKKDALESYRKPDLTRIVMPSLKPTSDPDPLPTGKMAPMPVADTNPENDSTTFLDDGGTDATNMNFFDTANSDRQLRDMSRAVPMPIPDANGYILGDEFLSTSVTPLLVFVNSRSGPQQGNLLITQFRRLLNPIQVWDLANGGPEKVLKSFSVLSRFQVLVCGGDGTVSWIISALERMGLTRWPPIGILPLGTGNDLARIHGWGGGYNNESLIYILRQLSEAYISMLDLWELDITCTTKKGKKKRDKKEKKAFLNYLGVGVDAQAALQVHMLRESKPKLFFSRFFNKAWYAMAGGEEVLKSSCANLCQQITLVADGVEIPLPPDSQGIIFLNIDSYSGGVPLWSKGLKPQKKRARRYSESDFSHAHGHGFTRNDSIEDLAELEATRELTACDLPSSCQDGLLDVVSIRGAFHLGQIRVGLSNAQLLCQCREATVTLKKKVAVQIDGEPWRQNASTLRIIRKPDRANMLNRSLEDSGGVETEVTKLLNWANEREVIDRTQYALIMQEFSRRTEHKKRKQKEKSSNGFSFVG